MVHTIINEHRGLTVAGEAKFNESISSPDADTINPLRT
jgi:hypothetical protein